MTVFLNVLKRIFTKKSNLLFMLILPTFLSTAMIYISTVENRYTIGIIDHDGTTFISDFKEVMSQTCKIVEITEDDTIEDKIMNDSIASILVFDKGYTQKLIQGNEVEVKSYYQEGSNYAEPIQVKVASYLSAARLIATSSNKDEAVFYQGMKEFLSKDIKVDYKYVDDKNTAKSDEAMASLGYMAFCMLFLMTFSTSLIMEDKVTCVSERLWVTPLSRFSYYFQHLLAYFTISMLQTTVVILVLPNFGKVSFGKIGIDIIKVLIICLLFSLVCISMGVAINRCAKNKLAAGSISSLINLPMLMLGGCLWPSEDMPSILQKIGSILPTTWFLKAGKGVIYGGTFFDVGLYLVLLFGFSVVVLAFTFLLKPQKN